MWFTIRFVTKLGANVWTFLQGTAVRFEPGDVKKVNLIDFGGKRRIFGFNDKVNGFLDGHKSTKY